MKKNNAHHILVIDDDERFLNLISLSLTRNGFLVTPANSGEDGIEITHALDVDAVVTDFRMRGLSGLNLVRKIHEEKPLVPIIIVTGYGCTEEVDQAVHEIADAYLLKPFQTHELVALVEKSLENKEQNASLN